MSHHPHHHTNELLLHLAERHAQQHGDDSNFQALRENAKAEHDQHVKAHTEAQA